MHYGIQKTLQGPHLPSTSPMRRALLMMKPPGRKQTTGREDFPCWGYAKSYSPAAQIYYELLTVPWGGSVPPIPQSDVENTRRERTGLYEYSHPQRRRCSTSTRDTRSKGSEQGRWLLMNPNPSPLPPARPCGQVTQRMMADLSPSFGYLNDRRRDFSAYSLPIVAPLIS